MAGEVRSHNERLLAPSRAHRNRGDLSVCYVCGAHRANCQLRIRPFANEPFFPFLEHHEAAPGSYIHSDGIVDSCRVCHAFLIQQWVAFDKNNTPIPKRLYWLKRADSPGQMRKLDPPVIPPHHSASIREDLYSRLNFRNIPGLSAQEDGGRNNGVIEPISTVSTSSINGDSTKRRHIFNSWDIEIPTVAICYGCGVSVPQQAVRVVHTSHWSKSESPYFPCILGHPAPSEARPVDQFGRVLMCETCSGYLLRQWQAQELENVPLHERVYHLRSSSVSSASASGDVSSATRDSSATTNTNCYLCGLSLMMSDTHIIRSRKFNSVDPFYPFLEKHVGASGALHLSSDGGARVCGACNTDLDEQWNAHDVMGTPMDKRVYRIPNQGGTKNPAAGSHKSDDKARGEEKVRKHKYEVCYLCSDITSTTGAKPVSTGLQEEEDGDGGEDSMNFPFLLKVKRPHKARKVDKAGNVLVCIPCYDHLDQQWKEFQKQYIPHEERQYLVRPRKTEDLSKQVTYSNRSSSPAVDTAKQDSVCFLCGTLCKPRDHYRLHSFPRRNQQDHQESIPFFPFLMKYTPAPNATPINSDGIASVCKYCYVNLNTQWHDYEKSSDFADGNRWLRGYNVKEFVCFICAQNVKREDIHKVSVKEYPCLLRHERPHGGIILEDNSLVITCPTCDVSLYTQKAAFDHLQVPEDKRAFQLTHSLASTSEGKEVSFPKFARFLFS